MPFQIQFDGPATLLTLQPIAADITSAAYYTSAAQNSANEAAVAAATAIATMNSDISAVTSAAALQEAAVATLAASDLGYLAYLPPRPGATLLAALPTTRPGSSGQWWIDGGVVAKS